MIVSLMCHARACPSSIHSVEQAYKDTIFGCSGQHSQCNTSTKEQCVPAIQLKAANVCVSVPKVPLLFVFLIKKDFTVCTYTVAAYRTSAMSFDLSVKICLYSYAFYLSVRL